MSNAMINSDLEEYDKKFVVEDNTLWEVWSNKISKSEVIWDMENICDLLNKLDSVNKLLKSKNENLKEMFEQSEERAEHWKSLYETLYEKVGG